MDPPKGYDKCDSGKVCRLKKSFYGLKQASRQCSIKLTLQLQNYGFKQAYSDNCLFTLSKPDFFLALLVYVDDVVITGSSKDEIIKMKTFLDQKFSIKDLKFAKYFLGLEIVRSKEGIYVN